MGIYMGRNKVGYSVTDMDKADNTYLISEKILMKLNVMGVPQTIDIRKRSVLDIDFYLRSFSFSLQSGVVKFLARGEVSENKMALFVSSGGREVQETIPLKTTPYLSDSFNFVLLQQGLHVGKEFSFPIFDPSTMTSDEVIIKIEAKEEMEIGGENVLAYRLIESFKGVVITVWVSEEGKTLREESPMGMVFLKETKEEALTKNWPKGSGTAGADIILSTAVPVNIHIERPRSLKSLKVRLEGISPGDFKLSGGRQTFKNNILKVTRENIKVAGSYVLPLREGRFEKHLEPSILVQSNDLKIVEQARRIMGGEKNALKVATMIMVWVYQSVDKKPIISIPSALAVLESKVGDCNEHTALFTALTRAAGIPTRIIAGIVFSEKNFYYHTWSEVYVGEWISIDPTMKQFPADATHIRLVEGGLAKQVEMMKVIGHLKAEILEYQ